jgi:hypothetical protein
LFEEAQQLAVIRHGRRDRERDRCRRRGNGARAARVAAQRGVPRRRGEVDETRLARFEIDETRQSALRKVLLARIDDRNRDDVMLAIEPIQRTLEVQIEKVG